MQSAFALQCTPKHWKIFHTRRGYTAEAVHEAQHAETQDDFTNAIIATNSSNKSIMALYGQKTVYFSNSVIDIRNVIHIPCSCLPRTTAQRNLYFGFLYYYHSL
jgi:hypothetical protein